MLWRALLGLRDGGGFATRRRSHNDRYLANQYAATGGSNPSLLTCSLTNEPFAILERVAAPNTNNNQNSYFLLGYMSSNNAQMFQSVFGNGSTNNGTRRMLKDKSHNKGQPARAWELPSAGTTDAKNSVERKRHLVEGSVYTFSNGSGTSSNTNGNSDSNGNIVLHNTNFAFFSNNLTAQAQSLNKDVLLGQECTCASAAAAQRADNGTTYFCPAGTASCMVVFPQQVNGNNGLFAVPSVGPTTSPPMIVYCLSSTEAIFLRYLFPLGIVLFFFVTFLFFCSSKGQYARGFCRKIFKGLNEEHYSRELRLDLERIVERSEARRIALERLAADERRQQTRVSFPDDPTSELAFSNPDIHPVFVQYLTVERRQQGDPQSTAVVEGSPRVVHREVVLRTRRFRHSREIKDEKLLNPPESSLGGPPDPLSLEAETECPCCSICLVDYSEGDRIATLDCRHVFHVDCVKSWIVRKNHCPLCKAVNVSRDIPEQGNNDEGVAQRAPPQTTQHQSSGPPLPQSQPQPLEIDH